MSGTVGGTNLSAALVETHLAVEGVPLNSESALVRGGSVHKFLLLKSGACKKPSIFC